MNESISKKWYQSKIIIASIVGLIYAFSMWLFPDITIPPGTTEEVTILLNEAIASNNWSAFFVGMGSVLVGVFRLFFTSKIIR